MTGRNERPRVEYNLTAKICHRVVITEMNNSTVVAAFNYLNESEAICLTMELGLGTTGNPVICLTIYEKMNDV